MSKTPENELDPVIATGWGLIFTPLCAVKSLTPEQAARIFTDKNPPGTMANEWRFTPELEGDGERWWSAFPEGHAHEYPTQCPDYEGRQHFLVNC